MMAPLPGSEDHRKMVENGVPIDADYNNYDSMHETFRHPRMAPGEWRRAYDEAMQFLYSKESIVSALLRAPREHYRHMFLTYIWYRYSALEGCHPMATGLFRLKDRRSRRPVFPRENVFQYAWRRAKDKAHGFKRYAGLFFEFQEIWMLTREPQDPRWATLADLRDRWAAVHRRIVESNLGGRTDDAAHEVKAMLAAAADRMQQLSGAGAHLSRRTRRKLAAKAKEVEGYLRNFDLQPSWRRIVDAEEYVTKSILAGYEELAIRYVAKRRRFNEYRREVIDCIKTGRILTMNVSRLPYAVLFELIFAARFGIHVLSHK
jgi:hypothetical protein